MLTFLLGTCSRGFTLRFLTTMGIDCRGRGVCTHALRHHCMVVVSNCGRAAHRCNARVGCRLGPLDQMVLVGPGNGFGTHALRCRRVAVYRERRGTLRCQNPSACGGLCPFNQVLFPSSGDRLGAHTSSQIRGHDTKVAPVSGSKEQNEKNCPLSPPSIKPSAIALGSRVWLTPPGYPEDPGFLDLRGCRTLNSLSCPDP